MFWIVLLGWLYVILMVAAASHNLLQGVSIFIFAGLLPVWLALWFFGIPARRRARDAAEKSAEPDQ